jgi:hypothetical protein
LATVHSESYGEFHFSSSKQKLRYVNLHFARMANEYAFVQFEIHFMREKSDDSSAKLNRVEVEGWVERVN